MSFVALHFMMQTTGPECDERSSQEQYHFFIFYRKGRRPGDQDVMKERTGEGEDQVANGSTLTFCSEKENSRPKIHF